jgi:DNA modification methylase
MTAARSHGTEPNVAVSAPLDAPHGLADYRAFLEGKFRFSHAHGFDVPADAVNPMLWRHQPDIVRWMVEKGSAAVFAAFGLGKTFIQIEAQRLIAARDGGRHLIIAPLGVRQEFKIDCEKLGYGRDFYRFVRRTEEVDGPGHYLTNYESVRDGKLDVNLFTSASLDEASVLRSYGSKTYQTFLELFTDVRYRFVATATPAPNRYKELIHYAGFLGVMDTGRALTRFFQRDSTQANNLTLYPHMEREFFAWLHSWAIFVQRPSDLDYSDDGYELPPLDVRWHELPNPEGTAAKFDRDGQGKLIANAALSLKDASEEKRESIDIRVMKAVDIIATDPDQAAHYILWHSREAERHAIKAALPEAVSVYGSQDLDEREQAIIDFSDGKFKYLSTKPEIAGSGCNFQRHCHKAIFVGIDYQFNDFIQAIHRVYRFLQTRQVEIHIIHTVAEREIVKALRAKWDDDERLRARMSKLITAHGLSTTGLEREMARTIGCDRRVARGAHFEIVHNDCVDECARMASDSVDLIHTSIPFGNHYEYSESYNDFGHNPDHEAFFRQMDYLTPELLRILAPGRIAAIHVKDRIRFGNVTGYGMPSVEPFHADCIAHYRRHGFIYCGMITVVTDVVRENNQTYRLGWTEQCKDGTKMGVGSPEYVLLFRKLPTDTSKGYADVRVEKSKAEYTRAQWQLDAHAFWRSSGNRLLSADDLVGYGPDAIHTLFKEFSRTNVYDYAEHVALGRALEDKGALPATFMCLAPESHDPDVWCDVTRMLTLNGEQSARGLASHICPLQFDIVDRIITRYTNPGETVFDPFGGLMTVPYRAVKLGRFGRGVELKAEYFDDGLRYLRAAEAEIDTPTLFDLLRAESPEFPAQTPVEIPAQPGASEGKS